MTAPAPGDRAPEVSFAGPGGAVSLAAALAEGPVALLFFTEGGTPSCDAQVRGFAAEHELIEELGARVLAASTDPPEHLARVAATLAPPFALLSDPDGAAARAFGVYDEAGRRARRAVFVIGADGVIRSANTWYQPSNSAHLAEVFAALGLDL